MADLTQTGEMTLTEWLFLLGAMAAGVFFLLTQQLTLQALKPFNRRILPGLVWLQVIPLFGQIWQFIVVIRIASSVRKERLSRLEDSLLTSNVPAIQKPGTHPTLGIGLAYSIFSIAFLSFNLLEVFNPRPTSVSIARVYGNGLYNLWFVFAPVLFLLGTVICWIIYWISLARIRRQLIRTPQ